MTKSWSIIREHKAGRAGSDLSYMHIETDGRICLVESATVSHPGAANRTSRTRSKVMSDLVSLLIAKWQYQDSLISRRHATLLTVEAAVYSATAIVISKSSNPTKITLVILAFAFLLAAVIGWQLRQIARMDRRVRNTFNRTIVVELRQKMLLKGSDDVWNEANWSANHDDHPINLWHTPTPLERGTGVRGTAVLDTQMALLVGLNVLTAIALIVWAIAGA